MTRNLLYGLCAPTRPPIADPFRVSWGGSEWDCATNGKCALFVRSSVWPVRDESPDMAKQILDPVSKYDRVLRVKGLLEYSFGELDRCESCEGEGFHDDGPCGCDGGMNDQQSGSVSDVVFNRRLLYRYLMVANVYAPSASHEILWKDRVSSVLVRDGDAGADGLRFMIILMPVRADTEGASPVEALRS